MKGKAGRLESTQLGASFVQILGFVSMVLLLAVSLFLFTSMPGSDSKETIVQNSEFRPKTVAGTLRVSLYGNDTGQLSEPTIHETTFVNGPNYNGMDDADLRGYLDGVFKRPWSQVSQTHVRPGRRIADPLYGEHELFRVPQRWDAIELPSGTKVHDAEMRMTFELPPSAPMTVLLYELKKDWFPGEGGTLRNNTSPPKPGEVWWGEASHKKLAWSLPGAGYAAETPDADTGIGPLASALVDVRDSELVFKSSLLTMYVDERVAAKRPLLFLIKLSDLDEDVPGRQLFIYSGDADDERFPARRPQLTLAWSSTAETRVIERDVSLEYGRRLSVPITRTSDENTIAATFTTVDNTDGPWITLAKTPTTLSWGGQPLSVPQRLQEDSADVIVSAYFDPVVIGRTFTAKLRNPWIVTGPAEEQVVEWHFIAPNGERRKTRANYVGDYVWEVEFNPEEIGRWRYYWVQNFTEATHRSVMGYFDVVAGDLDNIMRALDRLKNEIEEVAIHDLEVRHRRFEPRFLKLQRAVMAMQTPESYHGPSGQAARRLLKEVRQAIGGEPIPVPIPMRAWERLY